MNTELPDLEISYLQRRLDYLKKRQRLQDQYLEYDPSTICQERDRLFSERFDLLDELYSDCASHEDFIHRLTDLQQAPEPADSRNRSQTPTETNLRANRTKQATTH